MLSLIAIGAYLVLGIPGLIAWVVGAAAGMSVSGEWEEEPEDGTRAPQLRGGGSLPDTGRWIWFGPPDRRIRFAPASYPRSRPPARSDSLAIAGLPRAV
jgi:hypothetical protein